MGKGKVIGINTGQQGGTTSVSTVVTPPGGSGVGGGFGQGSSNPPGQPMTGTLQDLQTNQIVNFSQSFGAELGLVEGAKVNYQTVTVNGQVIANSVRLLQRGEILVINSDDASGTLLDHSTGGNIQFFQQYAQETGLVAQPQGGKGTMVHFEMVISPITGNPIAVALEIVGG